MMIRIMTPTDREWRTMDFQEMEREKLSGTGESLDGETRDKDMKQSYELTNTRKMYVT